MGCSSRPDRSGRSLQWKRRLHRRRPDPQRRRRQRNDFTSSVPDALLHGDQGRATGPIIIDRPTIVDPAALQELASPHPDDITRAFGAPASESLGPASEKCVSIALGAACASLAASAPSSTLAPTLPPPPLPRVILGSILRIA